ncbi:tail completion protein gp17 [Bifidobacterium parmae]|uniref:Uncharacterized protein n=1 Tax=Bifidobacterium parmae TaxID=361854 RepID=A0A2N5IVJ3_9BIFI|nr:DUF3168 domain-containing protein [Bifidobacterium parmae]PLS25968.1 hypothetical protein Uis4E_2226 [Bifidobacterium parmae]
MNSRSVKTLVRGMLPDMPHWRVYEDVATGPSPPWIVWRVRETSRLLGEAVNVTGHVWELDVRVVAAFASDVDAACETIMDALDGRMPAGMGALVPDKDSGVYASELTSPDTGQAFVMRVVTWRFGA